MEPLSALMINFIELSTEASPWLLVGLLMAGLLKAWVPSKVLCKHLGEGKSAIVKAAFIGAPLPLCSCGVIPVAAELRRSGASKSATSSFLVATPETGIDSVSVSYAMLGPVFAIYRPLVAIASAIITGLIVAMGEDKTTCVKPTEKLPDDNATDMETSCCSITNPGPQKAQQTHMPSCQSESKIPVKKSFLNNTRQGIFYAATKLIDDIIIWLLLGLIFATLVRTFIPESFLLSYGSGLPAMMLMIIISIPMYICATASTPIAAGFIMAGLSPGTALVFMMAGPATNISTLGVIRNEMGNNVLVRYLLGVSISAIGFSLLLDIGLELLNINISEQMQHSHELLPQWIGLSCFALLIFLAVKPLRRLIIK
jgi:hypothetical protein